MANEKTIKGEKNEAMNVLKKYLDSLGVNVEDYAKERKILGEKAKAAVSEVGETVRMTYVVPLTEKEIAKKPVEIVPAQTAERLGPVAPGLWPWMTTCDPEGFFKCLQRALRSQLEKVSICMIGPSHPYENWNGGEFAPMRITVTNHSDVTWRNVRVELHVSGPAYVVESWFAPMSDSDAFWPSLAPGESRSFYPLLRARPIIGNQYVELYVSICGDAALSKCTRTDTTSHLVVGN